MPSVQADLTVVSSFHVHIMAHAALKVLLSCKALLLYSAWANTNLRLSDCECSVARLEEDKRSPETLLRPASWLMAHGSSAPDDHITSAFYFQSLPQPSETTYSLHTAKGPFNLVMQRST